MPFGPSDREKLNQARASRLEAERTNPITDFGEGLVEGVKEDPFVALALQGLSEIPEADPEGLKELRSRVSGSTAAQAGRFIGEFGPSLLFGVATYGAGFMAGRAAIMGIARQTALKDAARTALRGAGRSVTRSELSGGLQPARGVVKTSLDRTVRKEAANRAGAGTVIQGTPGIQAAAERTGAAAGIGGLVTSQELSRGKGMVDSLKSGGLAAALTLGVDAALVGGSRLLFRGSRSVDVEAIKKRAEKMGVNKELRKQIASEEAGVQKITKKLRETLKIDDQQRELSFFHGARSQRSKEILATPEAQDLVRTLRAAKSRKKALVQRESTEGVNPYLGQGPGSEPTIMGRLLNRVDKSGGMRALLTKLTVAPEATFGTQGEAANKFFTVFKNALTKSIGEEQGVEVLFENYGLRIMKATGIKPKEFKKGMGKNLELTHAWEKIDGREKGVKELMRSWGRADDEAEEVIKVFLEREALEKNLYLVRGRAIGAKMAIDLEKAGVSSWLPHSSQEWTVKDLAEYMVKEGGFREKDAYELLRRRASHLDPEPVNPEGITSNDPVRNGPLEFNRVETGTTKDKILRGIPLNPNVWDSGYHTAKSAVRRIHTDPILGGAVNTEKGRVIGGTVDDLVKLVEKEGGSGIKVKATIEAMAGRTYYDESMRKWATAMTSIETAAKLPMAFLANATQFILTTTWLGYKASLKGMAKIANREDRQALTQAMNVHQHISRAIGHSMDQEGLTLTTLEKFADWTLRFTGFSNIERFNRIHGAAATQSMIRDRLARGATDKLRGVQLDTARKQFGEVGLDFDGLVNSLKEQTEDVFFNNQKYLDMEFTAMIQGAQKTQFFPGPTRTPALWKHPLARTVLQFKTFALGQSRLMRDAVLSEYSAGNMAPLATYLSAAPIAGELVGDARAFIKDKDRMESGLSRGLHNMSYIGGLGIVTDMFQVAQWGKLENFILGPSISDLIEATEFTLTGEFDQLRKMGQRQPAYQFSSFLLGNIGAGGVGMLQYLDSLAGGGADSPTSYVDVGQLLTERINQKR